LLKELSYLWDFRKPERSPKYIPEGWKLISGINQRIGCGLTGDGNMKDLKIKRPAMLHGKELILATRPFAKEIRIKSWVYALSTILFLLMALAATVVVPYFSLRLVFSILAGLLMVRMFIIYHDHQHHSILTHSKLADIIMTAFGFFILSPTSIWKRSHDHHHNNNSKLFSASIGSYPIATRKKFEEMTGRQKFEYLAIRHPLTIALGYFSMFIFGMCIASFVSSPRKHYDSLIALILHVTVSVLLCVFLGWQIWFCLFFLPFVVAFAMGAYLFYAQHNFPGVTFSENNEWAYEKAAMESSSYMVMNPVMAWLTGNIGYHHIHHLNSKIPFYRLPEVMAHFKELQQCKRTSLKIKEVIACLRLKIWDQDKKEMVGLREIR
jgi:omega-6 fatty acid desaturase (delta-12 desaturase)